MRWRLQRVVAFGTGRYPEKVARRLRAVNITAWFGATFVGILGTLRLFDPVHWSFGLGTLSFGAAIAATPLLHRFGSLAAPLALAVLIYAHLFRIVLNVGTGDGVFLNYLGACALVVLLVGVEHALVAAALAALAAGLMVTLYATVPANVGMLAQRLPIGGFSLNVISTAALLFGIVYYAVRQMTRAEEAAEREHARSEALLANILPQAVAARLKDEEVVADRYEAASVLFADMLGFTARASDTAPDALVGFLNDVFSRIDDLVEAHGLEKIKTTGDAYMVVAGVPAPRPDHAVALADLALAMREALAGLADPKGRAVPIRIGIASGPVVAGVVGRRKFFYDIWGDTVNVAARMEQTGEAGRIQVALETFALLESRFELEPRGPIAVRGKGEMQTWFLVGRKAGRAADRADDATAA